jgi:hypothetical protein
MRRQTSRLMLGMLAAAVSPGPAGAVPVTFEGSLNYPTVGCVIDGIPLRCQIDTGDDSSATLPATPLTAHLEVIAAKHAMGAAGVAVSVDEVKVDAIHVGNMAVTQPTGVYRMERSEPFAVLGRGFFQATQTVTFDLKAMTLTADGPSGGLCPGAVRMAALMEVPAEFDGQPIQAGWDTGAGLTTVDTGFLTRHAALFKYVKDMPGIDATQRSVPAKIYTTSAVTLCGHKLENMPVLALDLSAARARRPDTPDIILGDNLFVGHVWSFDFRDGRWSIN